MVYVKNYVVLLVLKDLLGAGDVVNSVQQTSIEAYRRAIESGLIGKQSLEVVRAYHCYFDMYPKEKDVTGNELIAFIYSHNLGATKVFDPTTRSHINKHQAPLRQQGVLEQCEDRVCMDKGTKAITHRLTDCKNIVKKVRSKSKNQVIEELEGKVMKLKRLMLLIDDRVSNIVVGETQAIQWDEFVKCFPEEG